LPKEGSPTATAYTTDTRTKVITVSQPNSIPAPNIACKVRYHKLLTFAS